MSFTGSSGGGFTGKSTGGEKDGGVEVLPEFSMRWGNDVLRVQMDCPGLTVNVGAASLCDVVTQALLVHHARAIKAGRRPGGAGQAPLDPDGGQGRLAAEGGRPSARGFTGKEDSLPNILTRYPMRVSKKPVRIGGRVEASGPRARGRRRPSAPMMGIAARAEIGPANALHAKWLIDEYNSGHEFFAVVGDADRVITKVVADYLAGAFSGEPRTYTAGAIRAREIGG